jgi:membrane-associated protease RseP (regulator of RpoE activity)
MKTIQKFASSPCARTKLTRVTRSTSHIPHGFLATMGIVSSAQVVHEVGHLFRAKHVGAKIERVSLGFGPILAAFDDEDGTIYLLHAFPLGCRVSFADDFETKVSGIDRAGVHIAGPIANVLVAALMSLIFLITHDHIVMDDGALVSRVITGGATAKAGIMEGDVVRSVNGLSIEPNEKSYAAVAQELTQSPELEIALERGGESYASTVEPVAGRLGWELEPASHVEEITRLAQLPGLVGEDMKLSIDSTVGIVKDFVMRTPSARPIRPAALLSSTYYMLELVNLNFAILNLTLPLLDGWKAGEALIDHAVYELLKKNENDV